jgi:hypothetical protein
MTCMYETKYPIDPAMDSEGRIRALVPFLGEKSSKPVPLPALDGSWDVEMSSRTASTSWYAKLGVSSIVSGEATLDQKTVVWDALVGKNAVTDLATEDTVIFQTFWGVGLRVAITYRSSDFKGSVNVASIAATAEYKRADVQYEIRSVGLGPAEFADVLSTVPPLGQFDMNAYSQLESVRRTLVDSLKARWENTDEVARILQPAILSLAVVPFVDELTEAAEYRFTMQCIASDLTLAQTLARLDGKNWKVITPERVSLIYKQVVGGSDKPTSAAKSAARKWLGTSR